MKLKRFCILSVLAAAAAAGVACISEPVYRYYIRYEKNDNVSFGERADRQLAEVWSQMLGCKVTAEDVSDIAGLDMDNPGWLEDNPIYKGVLKSGDRELKAYLATLSDFCRRMLQGHKANPPVCSSENESGLEEEGLCGMRQAMEKCRQVSLGIHRSDGRNLRLCPIP